MPEQNGFRKGKKEELISSLTDDEKSMILDSRELIDRKSKSDFAYKLFLSQDQARLNMNKIERAIEKQTVALMQRAKIVDRIKGQLESGIITEKFDDGTVMKTEDANIHMLKMSALANDSLDLLRSQSSQLYSFVNTKDLGMNVMLTEEEYDEKIKDIISKLSNTSFKLFD